MNKVTNFILTAIGLLGAGLVTEGIITGEELSTFQNITGIALGGGALSIGMIISIIRSIPTELVKKGYDKAVATYGEEKVLHVIDKFDDLMELLQTVDTKLDNVQLTLNENNELKEKLLNG